MAGGVTVHLYLPCFSIRVPNTHFLNLTPRELKDAGFNIQERGQIEVKGKGLMTTYFLLGSQLVSEDSIMGRKNGGTCLYIKDLQGQSTMGKGEKMAIYMKHEKISSFNSKKKAKAKYSNEIW